MVTDTTAVNRAKDAASLVSREIGLKVRARRNELGLTQTNLAHRIGVSQQQINKYESGIGRIPAEQLMKLCQTLRIELSSLYRPFENVVEGSFAEPERAPFVAEALADKDTMELVRTFQSIKDKRLRRKILDLIKTMARDPGETPEPEESGNRF